MSELRMTLANQFLMLQVAIIMVVVLAVAAVSLAQSAATFERVEGRRALAVAEAVAANSLVRQGVDDPARREALGALTLGVRSVTGVSFVTVAEPDGAVLTSSDPKQIGSMLPLGGSRALEGRSWTGVTRANVPPRSLRMSRCCMTTGNSLGWLRWDSPTPTPGSG